jgi:hypothetical protein
MRSLFFFPFRFWPRRWFHHTFVGAASRILSFLVRMTVSRSGIIFCIAHTLIRRRNFLRSDLVRFRPFLVEKQAWFDRQELFAMTIHEFIERPLHGPGQVRGNNSLAVAAEPFFHGIHYELLFGNPQKLALFRQPIELGRTDHHPHGVTGLVRLLRNRFRVILSHRLDRTRAAGWIHGARRVSSPVRI